MMKSHVLHHPGGSLSMEPIRPPERVKRWLLCFLGFLLLWTFMFVIGPWIVGLPSVKPIADYIEKSGIDAGALYYTEVAEVGEAEINIRDTFHFTPTGP